MSLQEQIQSDLRTAMKARESDRVSALRMALAAIKNEAVAQNLGAGGQIDDESVQRLLRTEVKRRRESADAFRDAGRDEQADREEAEAELYAGYLPQQLSDEELADIVEEVVSEVGAEGPGDTGKVMGAIMPKVGVRADGSRVAALVRERLAGGDGDGN